MVVRAGVVDCGASFCVGCMAMVCAVLTATQCIGTRAAVVCRVVSVNAKCYLCGCVCVCWCRSLRGEDVSVRAAADRQGADETEAIEEGETALRDSGGGLCHRLFVQCGCACGLRSAQAWRCVGLVA